MRHLRFLFLFLLVACIAGPVLAACSSSSGAAVVTPHVSSSPSPSASPKHMYLSVSGSVQVYDVPVSPVSTPSQTVTGLGTPRELFVDSQGRLFVPLSTGGTGKTVQVYDSPVLSTSTPAFTLTTGSEGVEAAAEDASGNVYVSIASGGSTCCIDVFPGPVTANATASLELTANGVTNGLGYPFGIAVAPNGDLYVSSVSSILEYTLPLTSGSTPAAIVTPNTNGYGLVVDSSSRVFVANANTEGEVSVFTQPFTSSSTPAFNLAIAASPVFLIGMAFDASGNLWAVDSSGAIWEVAAPISSSSTANKILTVPGAYGIAFGP